MSWTLPSTRGGTARSPTEAEVAGEVVRREEFLGSELTCAIAHQIRVRELLRKRGAPAPGWRRLYLHYIWIFFRRRTWHMVGLMRRDLRYARKYGPDAYPVIALWNQEPGRALPYVRDYIYSEAGGPWIPIGELPVTVPKRLGKPQGRLARR